MCGYPHLYSLRGVYSGSGRKYGASVNGHGYPGSTLPTFKQHYRHTIIALRGHGFLMRGSPPGGHPYHLWAWALIYSPGSIEAAATGILGSQGCLGGGAEAS